MCESDGMEGESAVICQFMCRYKKHSYYYHDIKSRLSICATIFGRYRVTLGIPLSPSALTRERWMLIFPFISAVEILRN